MPQREGALLAECLAHCKARDFRGFGKRVSCAKTGVPVLVTNTSYDMLLHKEVPFGGGNVSASHLGDIIPRKPPFGA